MTSGDLITGNWQAEYNGLLVGDTTDFALTSVKGVADLPDVRTADAPQLWRHGVAAGQGFLDARTIVLSIEMTATDDADLAVNFAALNAAFDATDVAQDLVVQLPGVAGGNPVQASCFVRKRAVPVDLTWKYHLPVVHFELFAADPLLYGTTLNSESLTVPTSEGGLEFNTAFDALFGAVSTGGSVTATNSGTTASWPTFTFNGPCTNPRIENVTTGEQVELEVELIEGQAVTVDMQARTVTEGTSNRHSWLAAGSTWFKIQPGDQTLTFYTYSGATATASASWRSAWL